MTRVSAQNNLNYGNRHPFIKAVPVLNKIVVVITVLALSLTAFQFYGQNEQSAASIQYFKPNQISLLDINISAPIVPLGLKKDKTLQVPEKASEVGWFEKSAMPGQTGTLIMVGHYDSETGEGIFYKLDQLKIGEEIILTNTIGEEIIYKIEKMENYPLDNFPDELVYGNTAYPSLRLITCSGNFNAELSRYSHNLVVYASRK